MISIVDIKKSINLILKTNFENVNIYAGEVKEGFKKPSFFVQLFVENNDLFSGEISENSITVEIVYLTVDKIELENIKIYERLKKFFNLPIQICDRKILPRNIRANFNDFLSFRFNLKFYDDVQIKPEQYEKMGELDINFKKE
ncbi:phage tail terminator family protein [Clostridium tetani]|uniref:phage tail terminator family protein n=1 Tax=Clostridium tetani TaxID=1513 RepID=UPI001024D59D|nr:hypothetical protein [Clostridium tetani]RXI70502.1 hypothetical protein DP127_09395 [Clostridium tetani]